MKRQILQLIVLALLWPAWLVAQPYIEVTSPNDFEYWTEGTTKQITWEAQGVQTVHIEWCANFNFEVPIANNWQTVGNNVPAGQETIDWIVPAVSAGTNFIRIRVRDAANPAVYDLADRDLFIIPGGNINILQPAGGEVYEAGDQHDNISWVATQELLAVPVKFEYTTNGGSSWQEIDNWFQDNGFYNTSTVTGFARTINWPIPSVNADQCRVRVSTSDGAIAGVSEIFSIRNTASKDIEVTSPDGGEVLLLSSNHTITWESKGVTNVDIEYADLFNYTYPGPNDWQTITTNIPAASGEYTWNIPALPLSAARIRISDASDNTVYDISDYDFTTSSLPAALQIISPDGGEYWETGIDHHNISWVQQTNIGSVKLFYSTDNGSTWNQIEDWINPTYAENLIGFARSVQWPIPNVNSSEVKVRIQSVSDPAIMDESDGVFTIGSSAPADIEVISPNGGETYPVNETARIHWNATGVDRVNIEYASFYNFFFPGPNMWIPIANDVDASTGQYDWQIPATPFSLARIRITDAADPAVYDISDNDFMSQDFQPRIELYTPNGEEELRANSLHNNVTWAASLELTGAEIELEYSINGGNTWSDIDDIYLGDIPFDGKVIAGFRSINWRVPDVESDECLVRVSVVGQKDVSDQSDAVFTIENEPNTSVLETSPQLSLLYPNPTSGILNWEKTMDLGKLIIYDTNGKLLRTVETRGTPIDISGFPDGSYHVEILNDTDHQSLGWQRIILMRQ